MKESLCQLLAPAGNKDCLYAAVNGGCDAIYLGGKNFSARAASDNFTVEELIEAIDYCHLRGVKVYIAVNTLFKDKELSELFNFLAEMYEAGADGFIIQDIGAAFYVKEYFSKIPIHASTQMNVHSISSVKFLESLGFSRIILSRECSFESIKQISEKCKAELEVFVHGALCVCYSGQCLMSSIIGCRSGNRGRCAQPCRLRYELYEKDVFVKSGYLLSPRDIMAVNYLDKLRKAGVHTLKLEGRMKTPEYVGAVTEIYRKYLDSDLKSSIIADDEETLLQVFNRGGGFSDGYLKAHSGAHMMSIESPKSAGVLVGTVLSYDKQQERAVIQFFKEMVPGDGIEVWTNTEPHSGCGINRPVAAGNQGVVTISGDITPGDSVYRSFDKRLNDRLNVIYSESNLKNRRRLTVSCLVTAREGKPLNIKLTWGNIVVDEQGAVVEKSITAPITKERLLTQLNKSGEYPFTLEFTGCFADDNIYIPVKSINELRRKAFAVLKDAIVSSYKRSYNWVGFNLLIDNEAYTMQKVLTVLVSTKEQFEAAAKYNISRVYIELRGSFDMDYCISTAKSRNIEIFAALPRVEDENTETLITSLLDKEFDGFLIRTFGQLHILKDLGIKKVIDYTFNIVNTLSVRVIRSYCSSVTLSPELTLEEINAIDGEGCEAVIHGRQILMTTRQCPVGLYKGQKSGHKYCKERWVKKEYYLKDRKGMIMPVLTDCDRCVAFILNSKTLFSLNKIKDMLKMPAQYLRLEFYTEDFCEADKLTASYADAINYGRIPTYGVLNEYADTITNGHFYRGVE